MLQILTLFGPSQSNGLSQGGIPAEAGFSVGQIIDRDAVIWENEKGRERIYKVGENSVQTPPNDNPARNTNFGIDLGFFQRAREILTEQGVAARLHGNKQARGGTSVTNKGPGHWNPFVPGNLFNGVLKPAVRQQMRDIGPDADLRFCCQAIGEEDRTPYSDPANELGHFYVDKNQREIIRVVNGLSGRPASDPVRFVMMRLGYQADNGPSTGIGRVTTRYREMMADWAMDESLNLNLVDCDDLIRVIGDNVHYNAASIVLLGRRMADAAFGAWRGDGKAFSDPV